MNIRLICMDLDGTLFGNKSEIPEINIRALKECHKRGIKLALVSGRNAPFIRRVAERIGVPCAIVSANGAHIEKTQDGSILYEGTFEREEWLKVMNAMTESGVNFEVYTRDVNYVINPELTTERHKQSLDMYVKMGDVIAEYDIDKLYAEAPERTFKFVAFLKDEESFGKTAAILDERGIRHCSSAGENIEVMPTGVDKGSALRILADYYGIDANETMAFGDFTNDLDMLKASGHPVAMGNAVDEVKEIAEFIAPVHTEGGVGRVIFDKVLKEE